MGQQQSQDELLFQQVDHGNTEGIKTLRNEGAGLEWVDREGKTPLIAACLNPELYDVAKTLIELGANVDAYRPGRQGGNPLHHAARRGLEPTVKLLLLYGANARLMNDDCQTPLDLARVKGYINVVRAIEGHTCLFSGWLRELYWPGFDEVLAPQLLSRKVWVVVLPCGSRSMNKPFKLELAIYSNSQDAQPRTLIALWKTIMEEPKFNQHDDPAVIISDIHSIPRRWRRRRGILSSHEARCKPRGISQTCIKLASANENDKTQLQCFFNACKGIPQVMEPTSPFNHQVPPAFPATAPPAAEDLELAIIASLQSSSQEANESTSWTNTPSDIAIYTAISSLGTPDPSKSTMEEFINDGPIRYPSLDTSSSPTDSSLPAKADEKEDTGSSSCAICLDAPVEGACVPCGHMAGCMSCLDQIKAKELGCPVCRGKIDQVIRLYSV